MNASSASSGRARLLGRLIPNPKLRFLDQYREVLRFTQIALRRRIVRHRVADIR
jgi:hypothetical protein